VASNAGFRGYSAADLTSFAAKTAAKQERANQGELCNYFRLTYHQICMIFDLNIFCIDIKGIASRDLMRKKRPADGFIG
jgi:hypothetical protein